MTGPATTPPPAAAPARDALLATELHVPRPRAGFLARSRLLERLSEGTARKLTLVCAPAGFGKTSVLGEWARRRGQPVAWLSLDAGDNDRPGSGGTWPGPRPGPAGVHRQVAPRSRASTSRRWRPC